MSFNLSNKKVIGDTELFEAFQEEYNKNIEFLESFSNLILFSGRIISFFKDAKMYTVNTALLDNSVQTLKSIKMCCSLGSFADANTLIRKLRDDLILYVYLLDVTNKRKPFVEEDLKNFRVEKIDELEEAVSKIRFNPIITDDEKAVGAWLSNTVHELPRNIKKKLSFENYMNFLKQTKALLKFLMNISCKVIGKHCGII